MTGPILFEITAADSHQQIILPVIRRLRGRGIPAVVYSDCELLRAASDPDGLAREEIPFVRLAETPLPVSQPEWEAAAFPIRRRIPGEVERARPALVVVLNDRNFPSNEYVRAARRLRVPTLLMQESLRKDVFQRPPWEKRWARLRRKIRLGIEEGLRHYGQGGCDRIAAWGETSREYFRRVGVPESRIVVTGNPRFDRLAHADFSAEAVRIRAAIGFSAGDFLLTFLSSPIERMQIVSKEEKRRALIRWMEWAARLRRDPDWASLRLGFKLHRGEDPSDVQSIIDGCDAGDWARIADAPLYPLLKGSQAAAMFSTTAGLEAALLSVPVGILELARPLDDWDLVGRGVAAGIRSEDDLRSFLCRAREDETLGQCGAQASRQFLSNLGGAAEAVADLAARMAGR
ncbi:MAG: glycosyltransferase [Anaerolineales bacterium]